MHGILFAYSILQDRPTFGLQLQNLTYRDEREYGGKPSSPVSDAGSSPTAHRPTLTQRLLFGALLLGERWLWVRLGRFLVDSGWADSESVRDRFPGELMGCYLT
jgi:hypothetical protein